VTLAPQFRTRKVTENDYSLNVNMREGLTMNLSAPTSMVFVISIVLAILAVLSTFMPLPIIGEYKFWVAIAAYVILACGNIFRGV
jgi:hypothetical protein